MKADLASPANAAPKADSYRADIDGLRAVAVLSVLLFHAFPRWLPGGFVGVDIFFVISGFLISAILMHEIETKRFTIWRFYARRIRRILPALLLMLTACGVAGWYLLFDVEFARLSGFSLAGLLSAGNIGNLKNSGYFDDAADLTPLLHLWSLGVEEQFYLVWPLLLLLSRGANRARNLLIVVLTTIAVSFALNVALLGSHPSATFYLPFTRMWELAIGALLAWWNMFGRARAASLDASLVRMKDWLGVGGIALLAAAVGLINSQRAFPGWWAILPTLGAALSIAAGPSAWCNRKLLAARPLVLLGLISYPLYLWHWPLLSFARIVSPHELSSGLLAILLGSAVVLAWLTYRFVETPIRHALNGDAVAYRLLAGSALLTVASAIGYAGRIPQRPRPDAEFIRAGTALDESLRKAIGSKTCESLGVSSLLLPYCAFVDGPPGAPTLVLWGDSHAFAWGPALFEIGKRRGYRVVVISQYGCAPLLGVRRTDPGAALECRAFDLTADALKSIARLQPARIFLTARWSMYVHGYRVHGRLQAQTHYLTRSPSDAADAASSPAAVSAEFPATIAALHRIAPLTLIAPTPVLGLSVEQGRERDPDGFEPTTAEHHAFEAEPERLIADARLAYPDVTVVDPADLLCHEKCVSTLAGTLLYSDDNHLTAQATKLFEPALEAALPK